MERLTLEEAIVHTKEVADMNYNDAEKFDSNDSVENYMKANCMKCAEEHEQLVKWLEELKSYKDLEEQGLLVRLPCKVGDILFRINKGARNPIIKMKVSRITIISKSYNIKAIEEDRGEVLFSNDVIGIKVFPTREEAENKLEELKNEI